MTRVLRGAFLAAIVASCGGNVKHGETRPEASGGRGVFDTGDVGSNGGKSDGGAGSGGVPAIGDAGPGGHTSSTSGGRENSGGTSTGGGASGGASSTGGAGESGGTSSSGGALGTGGSQTIWPDFGSIENCLRIVLEPDVFNHCGVVRGLEFTPDGKFLIGAFDAPPPNVHLWRLSDGTLVTSLLGAEEGAVCSALSRDGRYLGVCGRGYRQIPEGRVYDLRTYEEVFAVEGNDSPSGMAFSSDGSLLAVAGTGSPVLNVPGGSTYATFPGISFYKLEFSSVSPHELFTHDFEGFVTLDVAERTTRKVPDFIEVDVLSFSPDGRYMASATWNGRAQLRKPDGTLVYDLAIPGGGEGSNRIVWLGPEAFAVIEYGVDIAFFRVEQGNTLQSGKSRRGLYLEYAAGSPDGKTLAVAQVVNDADQTKHGFAFVTP